MERTKQRTKIKESTGERIFTGVIYAILILFCAIIVFPLLHIVSGSFSDPMALLRGEVSFWPKGFTFSMYEKVFKDASIWQGYGNTIVYTVLGTCISVVLTAFAAYPLSRKDFYGRNLFMGVFVFTMFFTGGMIPTFLVVKNLGLIDTVWSLVLPGLVSPWNMFIMKNYFQTSIPTELYEAASIDGADNFHLLRSMVLPLSAPIVAVMVLYYGVAHWNSYFNALLYLRDRTRYPLQLVLRSFFSANDYSEQGGAGGDSGMTALLVSETMKYALIVIASGPILCLYPLLQRFFVKGVMLGAIKG